MISAAEVKISESARVFIVSWNEDCLQCLVDLDADVAVGLL